MDRTVNRSADVGQSRPSIADTPPPFGADSGGVAAAAFEQGWIAACAQLERQLEERLEAERIRTEDQVLAAGDVGFGEGAREQREKVLDLLYGSGSADPRDPRTVRLASPLAWAEGLVQGVEALWQTLPKSTSAAQRKQVRGLRETAAKLEKGLRKLEALEPTSRHRGYVR